jgi:hypothetical protein
MTNKSLFIVGFVAAVAAGAAALVISNRSGHETAKAVAPKDQAPLFPGLREKMGEVAKIKLKRGAVEATLSKNGGDKPAWFVENRGNYPAEFDRVGRLIGALAEATIVEPKTSKPEYYEAIGVADVDKPGAKGTHIEFDDASGKPLAALIVGTNAPGGSGDPSAQPRYFVKKDGEAQTYLASGDLSTQPDPMTWLNRAIAEVDAPKVKSATITQTVNGQPQVVKVSKSAPAEQKYTLENMPAGRQLKDDYATSRVAQAMVGLTMDDVAPATGMDFSKPDATVEAELFDGEVITAKMINKDGKKWWAVEARYEEPPNAGAPAAPSSPDAPKPDTAQPDQAKDAAAKTDAAKADAAKADAAKAQADEKAAATKKVAEINEKCGPWAYILPEYKVTSLLSKLDDLLKPEAVPTPGQGPAPTLVPSPVPNDNGLLGPH